MTLVGLLVVGVAAGVVSAVLGVGGGVIFVPALAILFGFDQHLAQGTSLVVIVPTTLVGAVTHALAGRVVWPLAVPMAMGGVLGGLSGAQLALSLDDALLRRLFALFLAAMAVRMLGKTRRSAHHKP